MTGGVGVVVGGPLARLGGVAARAEAAGFSHVWLHEAGHDAMVAAAVVAGATSRVRVGTDVAVAFARTPTLAAFSAWDLQELSGGRFVLGLGSQVRTIVEQGFGADFAPPAARMGEYLQVVAATFATLRGRRTPFEGTHLRVTRPAPYAVPDPDRPAPPVLLAAVGPRMTQVAATHADGLVGHPLTSRAHLEQVVVPRVDAALAAAGRPRAAFTLVGGLIVDVDDDVAAARRRARRQVAFYGSTPNYAEVFAVTGDHDLATRCREHLRTRGIARLHEAVPDEALDRYAVAGSAADVRAGVARWRPLVDHLVVTPATVGRPPEEVAAATEAIIDALAPADPEVA